MTVKGRASKTPSHDAIAVIGIGCRYPGAKNPQELWENILARRQAFRRMPDVRMPPGDYFDADPKTPDKSYSARAAVIDGFAFDWRARRIPEQSANSTDIVHWLALEVALDALNDSGLNDTRVPKERTGVVIGNTLTGEQTRAQTMRLRWPLVARTLIDTASTMQLPSDMTAQILRMAETRFKSVFQPVNEDTLAGSLANTIAGRICNFLDLHGGGYTVDGACSSSLIAVATAANALANGDLDLAIAGGVDVSLDPFELIGFAKAGALTATEMRVYDEAGNGFMPGEGAGVVILKRLSDARRDGDNVYAVLKGWGISSDGKGGITAPKSSGQALAITRAYERAGYSPHTLDFIEGHGTGTRVGDKVELEGIAQALANFGEPPAHKVGMTSFKSICGHTKAAAGVGGFIKAVIAVNRRVLPPTAGCERPNASFADQASCLYPLISGEKRPASDTLRAGVSAMGFGGINSHVTLESGDAPSDKFAPSIDEETLLGSYQRHELFLFSAPNLSTLLTQFKNAAVLAHTASIAELADLSANLIRDLNPDHPVRAAFTVHTPEELVEFLRDAVDRLSASPLKPSERYVSPCKRVWITHLKSNEQPKLGFVFAGQGAQQLGMARTLLTRFAWARDLLSAADAWLAEVGCDPIGEHLAHLPERAVTNDDAWLTALTKTRIAQPAIAFVSLLWFERLKHLGLKAHVVAGHSLGELTALYAAGSIDAKTLIQLAGLRGSAMAATPTGGMLALRATGDEAARLANEINATTNTTLVVANINSPTQAVLSGDVRAIEAAQASAQTRKLSARPLRVSGAFHSPLMLSAAEGLKAHAIANKTFASSTTTILSCMHGDPINPAGAIGDFVATQMLSSVNFVALATNLSASCDLILELGPSRILSSLIEESTASTKNAPIALPVEPQPLSDQSASLAIGAAFALGANIDFSRLHEGRLIRPFVAASDMSFIENPCERPFTVNELDEANATAWQTAFSSNSAQAGTSPWSEGFVTGAMALATGLSPEVLTAYLRERGAYLRDIIEIDLESHPLATLATSKTAAPIVALAEKASPQKDRTMLPPPDASSKMHQSLRAAQDEAIEKLAAVPVAQTSSLPTTLPSDRVIVELAARRTGFPPASIEMQHRVLDDLNLDSIKAAEIVGEAAKQIGVAELVDPMQFANARLSDIADALDKARATLPPPANTTSNTSTNTAQMNSPAPALPSDRVIVELAARRTGFPPASIEMQHRVLDDLNLDSIKAAEIVGEAAKQIGVAELVDPMQFANARLSDIADALDKARATLPPQGSQPADPAATESESPTSRSSKPIAISKHAPRQRWVRNFAIEKIATPLVAEKSLQETFAGARVLLADSHVLSDKTKDALERQLMGFGASVESISLSNEAVDTASSAPVYLMAFFGETFGQAPHADRAHMLQALVEKLTKLAHQIKALAPAPKVSVALVEVAPAQAIVPSTHAWAASLHLEEPTLFVRRVRFESLQNKQLSALLGEFGQAAHFSSAEYDAKGKRVTFAARVQDPSRYQPRTHTIDQKDVVVVTGGARGITAACALALAKKTGARFALLGSSAHPEANPQTKSSLAILATLEQFAQAGIRARYYQCDVNQPGDVKHVLAVVANDLGPVTVVVHGAGKNSPRRVLFADARLALDEMGPKVRGAAHLIDALGDQPPKLFVALTSIIGITGMPGNAWYGFANELVDSMLAEFTAKHSLTQSVCVAYSVWDEIGMGAELGSLDKLQSMGIDAIAPDEGTSRFVDLALNDPGSRQVVVSARLGGLDTWPDSQTREECLRLMHDAKLDRFIENIVSYQPDVELIARTTLSLDKDPYLYDHDFRGSYLFPTVFGLEAMSQAVSLVAGEAFDFPLRIESIELRRPIVVSVSGLEIEVRALMRETQGAAKAKRRVIETGIYTSMDGFRTAHFSATFILHPEKKELATQAFDAPQKSLGIRPQPELYGWLLFQGPRFQRMSEVLELDARRCVFRVLDDTSSTAIQRRSDRSIGPWVLGSPYVRDALLQSVQPSVPQDVCLPISIGAIIINGVATAEKKESLGESIIERRIADIYHTHVTALDTNGYVREALSEYQLRIMETHPEFPTVAKLAAADDALHHTLTATLDDVARRWHLILPKVALTYDPELTALEKSLRRDRTRRICEELADRALEQLNQAPGAEIEWLSSDKPVLSGHPDMGITLAHEDAFLLTAVGMGPQGCDITNKKQRTRTTWLTMLPKECQPLLDTLETAGFDTNIAAAMIWATREAGLKALGSYAFVFKVTDHMKQSAKNGALASDSTEHDAVLFKLRQGATTLHVLATVLPALRGPARIVALSVNKPNFTSAVYPRVDEQDAEEITKAS